MAKKRKTKPKAAKPATRKCDSYEDLARFLLNQFAKEFGIDRVEGKQDLEGQRSGTTWEIDAKGVRASDGGIMVVECRRHTKDKAKQESIAALAYRVVDLGAIGGIHVSPLGMQKGAKTVASAENIITVTLDKDSTPESFAIGFLGKLRAGGSIPMFASGAAPAFPPQTGGGFFICGVEPEASPDSEGESESHEAP